MSHVRLKAAALVTKNARFVQKAGRFYLFVKTSHECVDSKTERVESWSMVSYSFKRKSGGLSESMSEISQRLNWLKTGMTTKNSDTAQ